MTIDTILDKTMTIDTILDKTKARLFLAEARRMEDAIALRAKHDALIEQLPNGLEGVQFIGDGVLFMHSVGTLEGLLAQVAQLDKFKPEILSYNLFCDGTISCKFVTSLGWKLSTYCHDIIPTLAHFSNGNCVIETAITETKSLKCLRNE